MTTAPLEETRLPTQLFGLLLALISGCSGDAEQASEAQQQLFSLVRSKEISVREVLGCLERGADVTLQTDGGYTPLHLAAAWSENPDVVLLLIDSGASVNARDDRERTPLAVAAQTAQATGVLSQLLARGGQVDARDDSGCTPLMLAARYNKNPAVVEFFVGAYADLNARDNDGVPPLGYAIHNKNLEVLFALLNQGANANARIEGDDLRLENASLLHFALETGVGTDQIAALLENGADPNVGDGERKGGRSYGKFVPRRKGNTPLHIAASLGRGDVAAALLREGADVNARSNADWTPLHFAASCGNHDLISLLLQAGADVHARSESGNTALHYAIDNWRGGCVNGSELEAVQVLLNAGARVTVANQGGVTPLHAATGEGLLDVAVLLLEAGADLNSKTSRGLTPLWVAVDKQDLAMVDLLLGRGSDVNAASADGCTPLHLAVARHEDQGVIDRLINAGADVRARWNGDIPLTYARKNSALRGTEVIGLLEERTVR